MFDELFSPNDTYDIRLVSQPDGYVCQVENGVGQFTNNNIESLRVSCLAIVGEIRDLDGTIDLALSGAGIVSINSNGSPSRTVLVDKTIKDNFVSTISIVKTPEYQTCSFEDGTASISVVQGDQRFNNLVISCVPSTYKLSGNVTNLKSGVVSFDVYESLTPERIRSFNLNVAQSETFEVSDLFRNDQYVSVDVTASPEGFICQVISSQIKLTQEKSVVVQISIKSRSMFKTLTVK